MRHYTRYLTIYEFTPVSMFVCRVEYSAITRRDEDLVEVSGRLAGTGRSAL